MRTIGAGPKTFPQLAGQLIGQPLALNEHRAEILLCAMQQRLGLVSMERIDGITLEAQAMVNAAQSAQATMMAMSSDAHRDPRGQRTFHADGDIAVIHVDGTLVHRFGWLDPMCGMTGYDGMITKLRDAYRDPDILGIWLEIDSPGGSYAGMMAFVEELAAMTASEGGKPIYAYVDEQCCSAAYAIASVCDRIYGPADCVVGSIGAIIIHSEISRALDEDGIAVRVFRSGDRKARGNSVEALDDKAVLKAQATVDEAGDAFCRLVAMGRGMELEAVVATEADTFTGNTAVEIGLIDAVLSKRDAWSRLEEETDRIKRQRRKTP